MSRRGSFLSRLAKEDYMRILVQLTSRRSTCSRRGIGAAALDKFGRVVGIGYNGVPSGFDHCNEGHPCLGAKDPSGDTTRCLATHAEQNLLLNCGNPADIYSIYLTVAPCRTCALLLVNLPNLESVHYVSAYQDKKGMKILWESPIDMILMSQAGPRMVIQR